MSKTIVSYGDVTDGITILEGVVVGKYLNGCDCALTHDGYLMLAKESTIGVPRCLIEPTLLTPDHVTFNDKHHEAKYLNLSVVATQVKTRAQLERALAA